MFRSLPSRDRALGGRIGDHDGSGLLEIMGDHDVPLEVVAFPEMSAV